MATKLGKLVTYGEMNARMELHVFLPPEDVWPPNLAGC